MDDRAEQPVVGPIVRVVAEAGDAGRGLPDLRRKRDDAVPGVGHVLRVGARLLHQLRVEIHDRQRGIDRQPVELAVDLAELDDLLGVVGLAPVRRLRREERTELQDLLTLG